MNGQSGKINDLTHSIGLFNFESSNNGEQTSATAPSKMSIKSAPSQANKSPETSVEVIVDSGDNQGDNKDDIMNSSSASMHDSQLFSEYKRNKAQILKQLDEQDRKRDEYIKQLKSPNVYTAALNAVSKSVVGQQQQIIQQQQQKSTGPYQSGKQKQQGSLYDVSGGATGTILEEEEEEEEEDEEEYDRREPHQQLLSPGNVSRSSQNGSGLASAGSNSGGSRKQDANSISPPAPPPRPQQASPRQQPTSPQSVTPKQRPIVDTQKFDSLEDITKAASFHSICVIEDQQAIRAVDIHPSGDYYVVGSNSKCLRVCHYPNLANIK